MAMSAESSQPRKSLIIKLHYPRSLQRSPSSFSLSSDQAMDSHAKKRKLLDDDSSKQSSKIFKTHSRRNVYGDQLEMKDSHRKNVVSNDDFSAVTTATRCTGTRTERTEQPAKNRGTKLASKSRTSRTGSEEEFELFKDSTCMSVSSSVDTTARSNGTRPKWIKTEQPANDSRTGSEESEKKMELYKKMQLWVILKRMMIGRDGWAFKHPLDPFDSESLLMEKNKKKKPILGFVDIESKLKNWLYSEPEQFVDDMRNVFSHALMYPSRSEVHIIGRRLSDNFEHNWTTLKKKWASEDRKQKRSKKV
ncbi:transcription factor GTE8-like [Lotus japonicus]|uniref:transcription factor GTE8-like n=1 Tax=Lotus japonicus TaxID=34305 RepID=UPI00258E1B3A|nr:transcription factor GTE8-like [Lotus japonicus]